MLRHILLSRFALTAVGLLVLAIVTIIYLTSPESYRIVMLVMEKLPAPGPFTDWYWIPSAIRCWSSGVDVYVANTCYRYDGTLGYNYSPTWLRLTFLQAGEAWTNLAGFVMAALFLGSLALLPPPRSVWGQCVMVMALTSTATFLAIERANVDIIMFLLLTAGVLLTRFVTLVRYVGYILFTIAGLLKFYPFVAFVLATRERPRVFWLLAATNLAILAIFLAVFRPELSVMAKQLPGTSHYTLQFAASNLPHGIGETLRRLLSASHGSDTAAVTGEAAVRWLTPTFGLFALGAAIAISRSLDLVRAASSIRMPDFLIVGAAVIVACFFAGQNVIYRAIFLLLVLPGLFDLAVGIASRAGRAIMIATCFIALLPLWTPVIEALLFIAGVANRLPYQVDVARAFPDTNVNYALWLASELAWWWVITILLAVLGSLAVRTAMWSATRRKLGSSAAPTPMVES